MTTVAEKSPTTEEREELRRLRREVKTPREERDSLKRNASAFFSKACYPEKP